MPTFTGTPGDDTLTGTPDSDLLEGLGGNDLLNGKGGSDTTDGGPGDDVHIVDNSGDVVIEAADEGNDTVAASVSYTLGGGVAVETLTTTLASGTAAIDLTGNALAQSVYGNAGDNVLTGGGGADYLLGLGGNDTYVVDDPAARIAEAPGDGDDEVITSVSYTLTEGAWVETLRTNDPSSTLALALLGNEIANSIYGNAGDNIVNGGGGDDFLVGLEGNDYLIGGAGTDTMMGGVGDDTYTINLAVGDVVSIQDQFGFATATIVDVGDGQTITVSQAASGGTTVVRTVDIGQVYAGDTILENAGEGEDAVISETSFILRSNLSIELLIAAAGTAGVTLVGNNLANSIYGNDGNNTLFGGFGNDYLVGSGGNDTLRGEGGNDSLSGGAGNDILDGNTGADYMAGGTGNDEYFVDESLDRVVENVGEGFDVVRVSQGSQGLGSFFLAPGVEIEAIAPASNTFTQYRLSGNELTQTITGGDSIDIIWSGGGADTLDGRGGDDTYYLSSGTETVVEAANGGNDQVLVATDYTLNAGARVETISTSWQFGTEQIDLTGNEFGQRIVGNFGSNVIDGKGGNDTLYGLGGADTFVFSTAPGAGNVDTIADFQTGIDTIALDDAVFAALPPGALDAEAFALGTTATEADDRIVYDPATGNLYYDADGSGAGAAVLFATLTGAPDVQPTDFSVI